MESAPVQSTIQNSQVPNREKEMESMAANDSMENNDETLGLETNGNENHGHAASSSYGSINSGANSEVITSSPVTPQTSSGSGSSSGRSDHKPGLKREKSFYTPHMEDKLCRKLKFFFMGPHEKFIARKRCPWKLLIQIVKIFLVTAQVIEFGYSRFSLVEYIEKTTISMKHLYLKDWQNGYETMPYPPAVGTYAVYRIEDMYNYIDHAMEQYDDTEKVSIGSLKYCTTKNGTRQPIRMCVKHYKSLNITPSSNTYLIDSTIDEECNPVTALKNGTYDIFTFWKDTYNKTINSDKLLTVKLLFSMKSFRLDMNQKSAGPQLFKVDVTITYDDSNQDGQMKVTLETDVVELESKGQSSDDDADHIRVIRNCVLDAFVLLFTVLSILLCGRSVIRAQQLKMETVAYFKQRHRKKLSITDQCEFLNLWYVTIIINDILTMIGTGYKIQLELKNLRSSSSTYDICSIMLGTGSLLAWLGLLRYIGFFRQFNVLIVTLKMAFPNMLRFLLCTLLLYFGFMICGWAVLGPYHIKFRHIYTASECLFSLVNGDDMFVTFSATVTNSTLIWYYSRIYLYGFISLYIYAVLNLFIAVILDSYETIKEYYIHGFPKSELFEFIEKCKEPAHHPVYRQEANRCDPFHLISCCCRTNPDRPSEYTSLIS